MKDVLVVIFNFLAKIKKFISYEIYNYIILKKQYVNYSNNIQIRGRISIKNRGQLIIKENVIINSGKKFNQVGYNENTILTIQKNARLIVGNNVGLSNINIFCQTKIIIGDNVLIGGGSNIWDTDFHSINFQERIIKHDSNVKSEQIIIEKNVFIGANVTILKGVTIGEGAVIGAGSVVSKSIPSNEVWAGNPITFIKKCN